MKADKSATTIMKKNNKCLFVLLLLLLFHIINNIIWLIKDTRPPSWDQAIHLNLSLDYLDVVKEGRPLFGDNALTQLLNVSYFYPPLYHVVLVPVHIVFGISEDLPVLVNILYLVITILSIYGIGKFLYSEIVGLLAAFLFSVCPAWLWCSRNYLIEPALVAWVTLAYYFFLKGDQFANRKYSIFFGIVCGIGMLTKWSFVFFTAPLFLLILLQIIKPINRQLQQNRYNKTAVVNLLFALGCTFLITSPWYIWNTVSLIMGFQQNMRLGSLEGDPRILSFTSLFCYFRKLPLQLYTVVFYIFIFGLVMFFVKWKKTNLVPAVWFVGSYLIVTLIRNKDLRFSVPLLPAVAIISVSWITQINKKALRNIICCGIVVIGLIGFFSYSYSRCPPLKENWKYDRLLNAILHHRDEFKKFCVVTVASDHPCFHVNSFKFRARKKQIPIIFRPAEKEATQFSDFVVYKTGHKGSDFSIRNMVGPIKDIENKDSSFHKVFKPVDTFSLPDNSTCTVFMRNPDSYVFDLNAMKTKLGKSLITHFDYIHKPRISIIPYSQENTSSGRFKSIIIKTKNINISGIDINDVTITLNNVVIDLYKLFSQNKLILVSVAEFNPKFKIKQDELVEFIKTKSPQIEEPQVLLKNETILVKGKTKFLGINTNVYIKSKFSLNEKSFGLDIKKIRLGKFLVVPKILYIGIFSKKISLFPIYSWPIGNKVNGIKIENKELIVF